MCALSPSWGDASMPCWRCGGRETDPVRGPSPWKRGVRGGAHVLVCPRCQADHDWVADLDHCPHCGSWRLVRQLGQVSCRGCGKTIESDVETLAGAPSSSSGPDVAAGPDLAADVEAALDRLTRRSTSSGA